MIGDKFTCARPGCEVEAEKTTHNQKYCSTPCREIETNRKIMEKYHERAAIKRGKKRQCSICSTTLSRYNQNSICGACEVEARDKHVGEAENLLASVQWIA